MSFEDEYVRKAEKKDPLRAFLPVLGLFLIVCFVGIAWALHEPLRDILTEQISDLPQEGEDGFEEVGYAVGGVVFVIMLMFMSLLFAAFAPKPEKRVSERELKKEKNRRDMERRAKKKRQSQIRKNMAEERKQKRN